MKRFFLIILGVFVLHTTKAQTPLTEAVDFTIKDVYGNVINLFDILDNEDKYVFIDFFAVT